MTRALREEEAQDWIAAGLCLARLEGDDMRWASRVLEAVITEAAGLPPVGVVLDVARLLGGEHIRAGSLPFVSDPKLVAGLKRYEDRFLGRLVQEDRLLALVDAYAQIDPIQQPFAIALVVDALLRRVDFDQSVAVSRVGVRWLRESKAEDVYRRGTSVHLGASQKITDLIASGYAALAERSSDAPVLLSAAEVFNVENVEVLGGLSQRMAATQAIEASEWISGHLPPVLRSRRPAEGSTISGLEDESTYPIGGFSSISTSGSIENLVASELAYMEPGGGGGAVDIFDIRYAEGELLYYTRDESFLIRRKRQILFVIYEDMIAARIKHPETPWQSVVIVLGLLVTMAKQLVKRLGEEDLDFGVIFVGHRRRGSQLGLEKEKQLAGLLLREWHEKGLARVGFRTIEQVAEETRKESARSLVQVILCSMDDQRVQWEKYTKKNGPWTAALVLGEENPRLVLPGSRDAAEELGNPTDAWAYSAKELIESIL